MTTFLKKQPVTQNVPQKHHSQAVSLRQCQALQQDQSVMWSAESPGCCLFHGGKLAWKSSQFLDLFRPYNKYLLWQGHGEDEVLLIEHFIQAGIYSKRKGLKSMGINGESVWGKYSVLIVEENCCLKAVEVPLHVLRCLNKLFWIHMPWVWIDLIVFQAAWNQQKDNTNRRMAPPEGSETSVKLHTEKPCCWCLHSARSLCAEGTVTKGWFHF